MRANTKRFIAGIALLSLAAVARAEVTAPDVFETELPRGEKRALSIYFNSGKLRITGADGDQVRVSATPIKTKESPADLKTLAVTAREALRAQGLKKLTNGETGLVVRQREDGTEVLFLEPVASNVEIKMPRDARLKIVSESATQIVVTGMQGDVDVQAQRGDVLIHDSTGSIKVDAVEGWIRLSGVTGPVEANTNFGAIEAVLSEISPDKPIWLSAAVGPIDIALPDESDATLNMRSTWGEIYSDFQLHFEPGKMGLASDSPAPAPPPAVASPTLSAQAVEVTRDAVAVDDLADAVEEEAAPEADAFGRTERMSAPPAEKKAARKALTRGRTDLKGARTMAAAPEAPPSHKRYTGRIGSGGVDIRLTTGSKNIYVRKLKK